MPPLTDQYPLLHGPDGPHLPGIAAQPPRLDGTPTAEEPGLKGNLHILYANRWLIGAATLMATVIAIVYALLATPLYEANLLIHVEGDSPNESKNILSEVSSMFETKKAAIAEIELLRSRMVVAPAVDQLRLYIDVKPTYFPLVGKWLAGRRQTALSAPGLFGYGGYVWGGEMADISQFEVPEAWQNRVFMLTAMGEGRYRLHGGRQPKVFEGKVGVPLKVPALRLELVVDRLDARAGAVFELRRLSRFAAIKEIQDSMLVGEHGKQSGIIVVALQGDNPRRLNTVLGAIGQEYLRQNLARKTEEAEKSLAFLKLQLPALKRQLEQSEDLYNEFRNRQGSIDMRQEARMNLQQSVAARNRRLDLLQKRTELLTRFTENHPVVRGLDQQVKEITREMDAVQRRILSRPLLEQDETRLVREIKLNTDLYTELSKTAQQLDLIAVGRISNVRLIDAPLAPERPIKPNRPVIVVLGMIIGFFLGIVCAFLRRALNRAIDEPGTIERMLGGRVVYATIPHSSVEERLSRKGRDADAKLALLAQAAPEDAAVESLRSFRTSLLSAFPHFRNNIVMVSSPTHDAGTSFVAANLAAVLAAGGKRVLLIDTDLHGGRLQRYFGGAGEPGLSDAVASAVDAKYLIRRSVLENLDLIPRGTRPPHRTELLMRPSFGALLGAVSAKYDLVLLDAPPILAKADALAVAVHAGAVFMLARAGRTSEREIKESIKRLNQAGVSPQGVLFNDLASPLFESAQPVSHVQLGQIGYGN